MPTIEERLKQISRDIDSLSAKLGTVPTELIKWECVAFWSGRYNLDQDKLMEFAENKCKTFVLPRSEVEDKCVATLIKEQDVHLYMEERQ